MKCPVCKGKGIVNTPRNLEQEISLREKTVRALRKQGYTFHAIMHIVGYKSPQSISKILSKK